ncbi:uncharacterized protein EAE97_002632 [Botrytis byssoidea]|uniref:Uncharacterized protein n=1 Tax=Botrytis byssoidea TaxID=139641 RepID=A0A9P5M7N1_9HELO|nr:uncharacterized protein EAE97_002632 [Botrytis byssoidea]KAF7951081.1 hypothetical protein EAE97_002632 [Botrytis byssoidea]
MQCYGYLVKISASSCNGSSSPCRFVDEILTMGSPESCISGHFLNEPFGQYMPSSTGHQAFNFTPVALEMFVLS